MIRFLLVFLISPAALADSDFFDNLRFRARENYEVLNIERGGTSQTYKGLSNTINLFYEKPFDYSYGLAFGSIFSGFRANNSSLPGLGDKIEVLFVGGEFKYFYYGWERQGFFVRPGAYVQQVRSNGLEDRFIAYSGALGLGYEFLITESISLAPEASAKIGGGNDYSWQGFAISIGVHFYNFTSFM